MAKVSTVRTLTIAETSPATLDAAIATAVAALKEGSYLDAKFSTVYDGSAVSYVAMILYIA